MSKRKYKFASVENVSEPGGAACKQYIKMRVLSGICKCLIFFLQLLSILFFLLKQVLFYWTHFKQ